MEFTKKMSIPTSFRAAASAVIMLAACTNREPLVIIQDPLVLQELSPLPRSVVVAQQKVTEYEPVYTNYRIIEVSEVNGVQRFFLARLGTDKIGVKAGVTGDIGDDAVFTRIIGNYKILEVFDNFFRCEIVELSYRIGSNAYIRVQIGEKVKDTQG